ncbi:hypothetical protein EIP91_002038 [Steccherinum ochraceum]|uniref:MYND-type domain-containing protein n=1 Tax=Steccherinum ochraceum TaxID=92696 RepID=A0A4R0RPZ5_9APHY|nr:hypothetical protein EIP91_002038 [Steccherinum ochraceum]
MSNDTLDLTVKIYGSAASDPLDEDIRYSEPRRHAVLELRPRIPDVLNASRDQQALAEWVKGLIMDLLPDVKHSAEWYCEFCDKPSMETHEVMMGWLHINPPKLVVWTHHVCDAVVGECALKLKDFDSVPGLPPSVPMIPPRDPSKTYTFPLARTCLYCKNDSSEQQMSRCSRCRLSRYCGTQCQRADWPRHKKVCKMVDSATWVWK